MCDIYPRLLSDILSGLRKKEKEKERAGKSYYLLKDLCLRRAKCRSWQ